MILETGKYYKTRDGRKAFLSTRQGPSPFNMSDPQYAFSGWVDGCSKEQTWTHQGKQYDSEFFTGPQPEDLVAEWKEPVTVKGWVNIYTDNRTVTFHTNKGRAEDYAKGDSKHVCTVYVTGTEGVEP